MKAAVCWVLLLVVCSGFVFAENPQKDEDYLKKEAERNAQVVCRKKHCGVGKECNVDEDGEPVCVCKKECLVPTEPRAKKHLPNERVLLLVEGNWGCKVCSNQNDTFASECELYRQKCLCGLEDPLCENSKYQHAWLDYFGECKEFKLCQEWEIKEYQKRMRNWLEHIMAELAERKALSTEAKKLMKERKKGKHWILPVIWKFCDLDLSHNKLIDFYEMLPLTAPLKAMEHCTGPFLDSCDSNQDENISLQEWGTCLGLEKDEIVDQCDLLTKKET